MNVVKENSTPALVITFGAVKHHFLTRRPRGIFAFGTHLLNTLKVEIVCCNSAISFWSPNDQSVAYTQVYRVPLYRVYDSLLYSKWLVVEAGRARRMTMTSPSLQVDSKRRRRRCCSYRRNPPRTLRYYRKRTRRPAPPSTLSQRHYSSRGNRTRKPPPAPYRSHTTTPPLLRCGESNRPYP